jgi:hypothetical protein
MIRDITHRDATRGTHKSHGRPIYGCYFGREDIPTESYDLVELEQSRGTIRVYLLDRDGARGELTDQFGAATRIWFAPIPMPNVGDELIYEAQGDGQRYRVRAHYVVPGETARRSMQVQLVSDGTLLWVTAERLELVPAQEQLDRWHAEALELAQIELDHAEALAEDFEWDKAAIKAEWEREQDHAEALKEDAERQAEIPCLNESHPHIVATGPDCGRHAPRTPDGNLIHAAGLREYRVTIEAGSTDSTGFTIWQVMHTDTVLSPLGAQDLAEVAAHEQNIVEDAPVRAMAWDTTAGIGTEPDGVYVLTMTSPEPDGCEGAELEQVRTEVQQQLTAELGATLPGISAIDIPSTCTCTYRPLGDRGPLAQRMRRVEHSGNDTHCPVPGHRDCTCTYRPLDCPVPGHVVTPTQPEQPEDYSPPWMSPLDGRDGRNQELRELIDAYAMAAVRCARWTTSGVGTSNAGFVLGKAAARLEHYLNDMQ